jgi:N-acyl-D-amino-acid deacylase
MARYLAADTAGRLALLGDGGFRAELRAAPEDPAVMFAPEYAAWVVSASPHHPELVGTTVAAATPPGTAPSDFLCDVIAADGLGTELQIPAVNRDRAGAGEMCADATTLVALGDAGAHVTSVTSYTYPTDLLARVVRDDGAMTIEAAVEQLTRRPAAFFGLTDRGELRVGGPADVCVVALDDLGMAPLRVVDDLPGGAHRLYRGARGFRAVLVNGEASVVDDALAGARSGRFLRAGEA